MADIIFDVPEPSTERRASTNTRSACERFLAKLAQTGNPSIACQLSGLTRRQITNQKQRDPVFAAAYADAMDDAADLLEAEAWRRALEGVAQPVLKAGQPVLDPATGEAIIVRRYSDALLVMLLRGSRPEKFVARFAPTTAVADPSSIMREIAADNDPPRTAGGMGC